MTPSLSSNPIFHIKHQSDFPIYFNKLADKYCKGKFIMITTLLNTSIAGINKSIEKYNSIMNRGKESDLIKDITDMMIVSNEFKTNTKAVKVADEMLGTIIDIMA
jgi:hypothetical protein